MKRLGLYSIAPILLIGGTQDNGTKRIKTGSGNDWSSIYGGDGFVIRVDPTEDKYVYASSQHGMVAKRGQT